MHSLAMNHPFCDGNKRIAFAAMRTLLRLNGSDVTYEDDEAETFVLDLAAGKVERDSVRGWIAARLVDFSG